MVLTLTAYPPPTCDETGYSSAALALYTPGSEWPDIFPEGLPRRDVASYFARLVSIYNLLFGLVLKLFGPRLVVARLFAVAGWGLASFIVYRLGSMIYEKRYSVLAALLFATATKSMMTAHTARPEIWVSAAVLLALWAAALLLNQKSSSWHLALLTGLAAALPTDIHLNGAFFSGAVTLSLTVLLVQQRRWRSIVLFYSGVLLGFVIWLGFTAMSGITLADIVNFQRYFSPLRMMASVSDPASPASQPRILLTLSSVWDWLMRVYWTAGGPSSLIEGVLGMGGILWGLRHKVSMPRLIAVTALTSFAAFLLLNPLRWVQYGALWTPLWYLLGLGGLIELAEPRRWLSTWAPLMHHRLAAGLMSLIMLNLLGDAWLVYRYRDHGYGVMSEAIAKNIPAGSRVLADPIWWWALREERTFITDEYFIHTAHPSITSARTYLGVEDGISHEALIERLLQRLQPHYVILDNALGCSSEPGETWWLLAAEIEDACQPVARVTGVWAETNSSQRLTAYGSTSVIYVCQDAFLP